MNGRGKKLNESFPNHEAVADMDAVVDTETNRDDDINAGHDVDGDVPEVEVANNVNQSDAHQHHHLHHYVY